MDNIHTTSEFNNSNRNNQNNANENEGMRPVLIGGSEEQHNNPRDQNFGDFLKGSCCYKFSFKSFIFIISIIDIIIYLATIIYGKGVEKDAFQFLAPTHSALYDFGMKVNEKIAKGHVWRWITFALLHANFMHIFFNVFSQLVIGPMIESVLGVLFTIILYFVSSIGGGIFSSVVNRNADCVGASVAIFGLVSAYIAYVLANFKYLQRYHGTAYVFCRILFVVMILLLNVTIGFSNRSQRIDNWGHLGGFIFGFFLTFILITPKENDVALCCDFKIWKIVSIVMTIILFGLFLVLFFVLK